MILMLSFCIAGLATDSEAESEFDRWKKKELGQYKEFREKRDRDFTDYLKKQWEEFRLFQGEKFYKKPKPVKIPEAPKKRPEEDKPFSGKVVKITPPKREPPREKPVIKLPEKEALKGRSVKFEFYGQPISLRYDPALKSNSPVRLDEKGISAFWEGASKGDFNALVKQLDSYRDALQLNDWGYHRLTRRTGEAIYGNKDQNGVTLFTWFILSKAGFDAKAAYNEEEVFLLTPSKNRLYGTTYLELEGKRYYALSFDGKERKMGSLFTYKGRYPGANRRMDYAIGKTPLITEKISARTLAFKYRGRDYSVPVEYDRKMAAFFEYYPQTDFEVYFNASVSKEAGRSLASALTPIIKGKTEGEAVNIIIRFVQTAFRYKTDGQQFGREKYFLPDEILFYPYSDCEDRSILFAYLVKQLVGLEVIGLHYPGHMATAVRFNGNAAGDSVTYKGKKYLVCDPTYINADIGVAMPQFKLVRPEIIPIGTSS